MFSEGAMFDWSGIYFQDAVQAPEKLVPLGYLSFMSTMTGGRFVGDYLANRLGRRAMLQLSGVCICTGSDCIGSFPDGCYGGGRFSIGRLWRIVSCAAGVWRGGQV